jgi:long-chain fatty acid transport protein
VLSTKSSAGSARDVSQGRRGLAFALAAIVAAATAGTASAAGFALFEQGARATALGGAFVAQADDPSAMFFNPAGNAFNEGLTMSGGGFLILRPTESLDGLNPYPGAGYHAEAKKEIYWLGSGYAVLKVAPGFNIAAGFWSPYGLGVPWDNADAFLGRYINQRVDLRQVALSVQASVKLADWIAIGAGPEMRLSDVKLSKNVAGVNPFTQKAQDIAHLSLVTEGTPVKWAWGAGILLTPCPRLRFGAAFHSHVDFDYSGTAHFTQIPTGSAQFDAAVTTKIPFNVGVPGSTTLQFPSITIFGASYDLTPKLTIEADANYTTWKVFDQTIIHLQGLPDTVLQHDWKNTWTLRGGLQYKPTRGMWVGGGFLYDQSPQPDGDVGPFLPDANRTGVSVGGGFKVGFLQVDVGGLFLWFHQRTITTNNDNFSAVYKTFAILPGISLKSSF